MSCEVSTTRTTMALPTMPVVHTRSTRKTETTLYSGRPSVVSPWTSEILLGPSILLAFSVMPCRPGGVGRGSSERQPWVGLDYRLALDLKIPAHGTAFRDLRLCGRDMALGQVKECAVNSAIPPCVDAGNSPLWKGDCTLYAVKLSARKTEGLAAESAASLSLNTPTVDRKDAHLLLRVVRSIETMKPKMSLALILISDLHLFL